MAHVLIVDDDLLFNKMLTAAARGKGHDTLQAYNLAQARESLTARPADLVFLDVRLPDGNGLQAIPELKAAPGNPEIVIVTGEGDPDGAELAIHSGAWDYLQKPCSLDKILLTLKRALDYRREKARAPAPMPIAGIVGRSPALLDCLEQAAQAAESDATVLVHGETGTGKELLARSIHDTGSRSDAPFVVVDCGALPETLLEAELFGHAKGAFTGAAQARDGLVRLAHGGTLFLDEVGELPLAQQKAFLRVLQERRFRPLGTTQEIQSDFRLLAATNRDLEQLVREGRFREDLLFRLRTMSLRLPPLRERHGDVSLLAQFHMERLCAGYGLPPKELSDDFLEVLEAYPWPGNVRELFGAVERAVLSGKHEPTLFATHLPVGLRVAKARSTLRSPDPVAVVALSEGSGTGEIRPWKDVRQAALDTTEKRYCLDLVALCGGNITRAAALSGISRQRLHEMLRKHGITRNYSLE